MGNYTAIDIKSEGRLRLRRNVNGDLIATPIFSVNTVETLLNLELKEGDIFIDNIHNTDVYTIKKKPEVLYIE